eukprot:1160720-Pelagomonas_calceolata.AAC.9
MKVYRAAGLGQDSKLNHYFPRGMITCWCVVTGQIYRCTGQGHQSKMHDCYRLKHEEQQQDIQALEASAQPAFNLGLECHYLFLVYAIGCPMPAGAAWHETWCEKAYHDETTLELKIERTANKWARAENGARWHHCWLMK